MVAKSITTDQLLIMIVVGCRMRPGSNNRHLPPQHIEELRQLVNACLSQPCADVRYSRVASYRLLYRRAIIKRCHRTKLEYLELLAVEPVPGLLKERGTTRIQLDRKGDNEKHRRQKHDAH